MCASFSTVLHWRLCHEEVHIFKSRSNKKCNASDVRSLFESIWKLLLCGPLSEITVCNSTYFSKSSALNVHNPQRGVWNVYEKGILTQCYFILNLHLSDGVAPNDIQLHLFEIEQSTIVSLSVLDDVFSMWMPKTTRVGGIWLLQVGV